MFKKQEIHLRGVRRKMKIIHIDIHMRILLQMFFKNQTKDHYYAEKCVMHCGKNKSTQNLSREA